MAATTVSTINETSFAVAYSDASALMLDAMALTGSQRREAIDSAQRRLNTALKYTDIVEERVLAHSLLSTIDVLRLHGLDI